MLLARLQVLARLSSTWRRRTQVLDQFWVGGIKVLHVVLLVGFSIGMVVSLQTGIELARIGQQDQIGTLVSLTMAREMGPFITATILAGAAGTTVENQGAIAFDGDGNGTNESTAATDNPETPGSGNSTSFVVAAAAIPTLSPLGMLALALLLAALAMVSLKARRPA